MSVDGGKWFRRWRFYEKIVLWYIWLNNHTEMILNAFLNKNICLQYIHIFYIPKNNNFQEMVNGTVRVCYPRVKTAISSMEPHYPPWHVIYQSKRKELTCLDIPDFSRIDSIRKRYGNLSEKSRLKPTLFFLNCKKSPLTHYYDPLSSFIFWFGVVWDSGSILEKPLFNPTKTIFYTFPPNFWNFLKNLFVMDATCQYASKKPSTSCSGQSSHPRIFPLLSHVFDRILTFACLKIPLFHNIQNGLSQEVLGRFWRMSPFWNSCDQGLKIGSLMGIFMLFWKMTDTPSSTPNVSVILSTHPNIQLSIMDKP